MPRFVLPLVLSLSLVDVSSPQNKVPRFKDYPVSEVYIGRNAPLVLSRGRGEHMWNCSRCGESVEDHFQVCWNCQATLKWKPTRPN